MKKVCINKDFLWALSETSTPLGKINGPDVIFHLRSPRMWRSRRSHPQEPGAGEATGPDPAPGHILPTPKLPPASSPCERRRLLWAATSCVPSQGLCPGAAPSRGEGARGRVWLQAEAFGTRPAAAGSAKATRGPCRRDRRSSPWHRLIWPRASPRDGATAPLGASGYLGERGGPLLGDQSQHPET